MELKANELRLNNLCYRTNKLTKEKILIELTASCILDISANAEMSSFVYEPIPLTEEWLLKFGWVLDFENQNIKSFMHKTLDIDKINCVISNNFFYWNCWENTYFPKYVHQLQNLYFTLTNKELEIKM